MSDVRDAISQALALNQRLAAKLLVQKQALEAELAAGPAEGRAEAVAAELASVDAGYRSALAEIAELRKLGARAGVDEARALAASLLDGDPVLQTHEERALAGAREHLAELEAQASLGEASAAPADAQVAPAARPPTTREQADAEARAEFEALRARRGAGPAPAPGAEPDAPPPARPKRTM